MDKTISDFDYALNCINEQAESYMQKAGKARASMLRLGYGELYYTINVERARTFLTSACIMLQEVAEYCGGDDQCQP